MKKKYILIDVLVVCAVIITVIVFAISQKEVNLSTETPQGNDTQKEEKIKKIVSVMKSKITLPVQIDRITTLVDITAEPNSILSKYVIHDVSPDIVNTWTNDTFKKIKTSSACKDIKTGLGEGINADYSYAVQDSSKTFFISITSQDCL